MWPIKIYIRNHYCVARHNQVGETNNDCKKQKSFGSSNTQVPETGIVILTN